ncbi:MAG TPA: DMT family transporter [Longimicrobium sp.]|nr:DMT family transporter [Longimicrobium sp.]
MDRTTRRGIPPIPAVLLAGISVQAGAAIAKGLFPLLGAPGTTAVRTVLAAAMLLLAFRPRVGRFTAAQWRAVVPYGVILGVMNLLFYQALSRLPLGLAITLEFIGPLGVAVAGSRRAVDVVWVVLAAAGIALIAPWSPDSGVDPLGVALALSAGACWAAYIVLGGRVSRLIPGGTAVAVGMAIAGLTVLPFALASGDLARLTPRLLAAGVGLALLSSAVPFTLEMFALKAIPARTFGILMSLEPAVGALCGLIFLGEILSVAQWLAVVLVIAASAGAALTVRAVAATPEV